MRFSRRVSTLMTLAALILSRPAVAASVNDFISYGFVNSVGATLLPGQLHVPADYASDPTTPRPLILFLHGAGESGTNNLRQINGNIDNLLAAAKSRGAFLYAPQTNVGWENETRLSQAMTMIDRAIAERSVDPNRIYVTGLSMGGGGAWNFLNLFPDRVAATVPIAGVYPSASFMPTSLFNEPIWAFHGRSDTVVPVQVTRDVVNSLLNEAGLPIPTYPLATNVFGPITTFDNPPLDLHYTDYRGNHGIWPQVYNTPELYDWLFARSSVPEPSTIVLGLFCLAASGCSRRRMG